MCIRDRGEDRDRVAQLDPSRRGQRAVDDQIAAGGQRRIGAGVAFGDCLLYTSDAADERSSVDLGGRRIRKKKKKKTQRSTAHTTQQVE